MNSDHRALLDEAIAALKLRDIMLNTCSFRRPNPPPTETSERVNQLTKRLVSYVLGDAPAAADGGEMRLLQVIVALGIRIADLRDDVENQTVYFEIEADFLVEYDVTGDLSDAAIKVFADLNSVHNVWPFWRQHVFDTVSRARLPHLEVPLFSLPSSLQRRTGAPAPPAVQTAIQQKPPKKRKPSAQASRRKS